MQLYAFAGLGWGEIMIIMIIGVLLFGRRLPEVGRSLGKGIVEFKKGIKGVEDDIDVQAHVAAADAPRPPKRVDTMTPKFEEPLDSEGKPRA